MADAFEWGKGASFKLDNTDSTAALTDISDYTNNVALRTAFTMFRVEGIGSSDPERQHGMADLSAPVNGFVNSTTEAIFGPLQGSRTSVTKTFAYSAGVAYNSTTDYWYTGEVLVSDVEMSAPDPDGLQTWSCTLNQSGAISRTTTEPS